MQKKTSLIEKSGKLNRKGFRDLIFLFTSYIYIKYIKIFQFHNSLKSLQNLTSFIALLTFVTIFFK